MQRRRWLLHMVVGSLSHRKGRTLLLLAVLAMACSLATALGVVSASMGKRVAEETRRYGANLVVTPKAARLEVGSGRLSFGAVSEQAYLREGDVEQAWRRSGLRGERSLHLRSVLRLRDREVPVEGVDFRQIRRIFPWWQVRGSWPAGGAAMVGCDLASRFGLKPGDKLELAGARAGIAVQVAGIVTTGGEEDGTIFLWLPELQQKLELHGQVSQVRLLVPTGRESLKKKGAALQALLPGAVVKEVRQVAHTSEELLGKVKLLMMLVTAVVLVCAGSSVAGTMSATVLERGKEIGLMKAMGGTRWDLLRIFSLEALMLGLAGGACGYLVGGGIAEIVTRTVFSASAGVVLWPLPVSLAVGLLLALLGSLGPLMSVFRLDPVRSLRGE